jgi:biopolymer transport protein ExbD
MSSSSAFVNMSGPGPAGGGGEDEEKAMSEINTTPLVDVMLVLLIVFMITIPVVTQTVPVQLPDVENIATETKPENINISVNREGQTFWNSALVSNEELLARLESIAGQKPQPEVHVRADQATRYEYVGRVIVSAQRKGIMKVGFITQPASRTQ